MLLIPFLRVLVNHQGFLGTDHWCPRRDSNPEPTDYESAALTVELQGHTFFDGQVYHEVGEAPEQP